MSFIHGRRCGEHQKETVELQKDGMGLQDDENDDCDDGDGIFKGYKPVEKQSWANAGDKMKTGIDPCKEKKKPEYR